MGEKDAPALSVKESIVLRRIAAGTYAAGRRGRVKKGEEGRDVEAEIVLLRAGLIEPDETGGGWVLTEKGTTEPEEVRPLHSSPPVFVEGVKIYASDPSPPRWLLWDRDEGERRFYFENQHGEVWIAHAGPGEVQLTGQDIGWKTIAYEAKMYEHFRHIYRKEVGEAPSGYLTPGGFILNAEEADWMVSVFNVAIQLHRSVELEKAAELAAKGLDD